MKKFMTRKEKASKSLQKKRTKRRIAILMAVSLIAVMMIIFLTTRSGIMDKTAKDNAEITQLSNEIAKEEVRAESLKQRQEYVNTKEYIEKVAKEKLGLVYPDEIVFKAEGK